MPLLPLLPALAMSILPFDLPDTAGVHHTAAEFRNTKAAVFAFIGTDCPISNSYTPELGRIYAAYAPKGIAFYAVHSDPTVSEADVRQHALEYKLPFATLMDRRQQLARAAGVVVTLEIAVISPKGELLY